MKAIEIYLDESGEIRPDSTKKEMNISGLVLKGSKENFGIFHAQVYKHLVASGKTVGRCDRMGGSFNNSGMPRDYLPKRPGEDATQDDWNAHIEDVRSVAAGIEVIAQNLGIEIAGCSLVFPASSASPFRTVLPEAAVLLDRSYVKRMEDILEFLFLESPFVGGEFETACEVSVNLATRVATMSVGSEKRREKLFAEIPSEFGHMNCWSDREKEHKLICDTIQPSSASAILSGAMSRRPNEWAKLSQNMRVQRCVCCKLADWGSRASRNFDSRYDVSPRHVHYFADFLCNFVLRRELNQFAELQPFKSWLERGFFLNAKEQSIDPWLDSMRMFANGDRVEALVNIGRNHALDLSGQESRIIRDRTKQWANRLSGDDMRALFKRFHPSLETKDDANEGVIDDQTGPKQRWIGPVPLAVRMDEMMKAIVNRFPEWNASREWASTTDRSGETVYWVPLTCDCVNSELPEEFNILGRTFILVEENPES